MEIKLSLKAARINANLTQMQVAKKLNVTQGTIRCWETGKHSIKADNLNRLCSLYNIPVSNIILPN